LHYALAIAISYAMHRLTPLHLAFPHQLPEVGGEGVGISIGWLSCLARIAVGLCFQQSHCLYAAPPPSKRVRGKVR